MRNEDYIKSLQAHGLYGNNRHDLESSSESSDDSSEVKEFDDKYYSLQPPPVDIDTNNVVIIGKKIFPGTPIQIHNVSNTEQKNVIKSMEFYDKSLPSVQVHNSFKNIEKPSNQFPLLHDNSSSLSIKNHPSNAQLQSVQDQNISNQRPQVSVKQPLVFQNISLKSPVSSQSIPVHNEIASKQRPQYFSGQSSEFQSPSAQSQNIPNQISEITSRRPVLSQYSISSQPLSVHNQTISNGRPERFSGQPWEIQSPSVQNQRGSYRGLTNINSNFSTPIQTVPNRRLETSSVVSDPVPITNNDNYDINSSSELTERSEVDCCSFCCIC